MSDVTDDTNFFWQSKYGVTERNQGIVDGTDALANGGKFVISLHHLGSGKEVFFKAFITNYSENFNNEWKSEVVFGRTDPIYTYSSTRRTISLAFDVPASSEQEAYENMGRIQKLAQMQYSTYDGIALAGHEENYTITQAPLVRIKVMNLIQKNTLAPGVAFGDERPRSSMFGQYGAKGNASADMGILAAINNVGINTDVKSTAMFERGPNVVLPQNFSINLDFNVIHEKTNGYDMFGDPINRGLMYDVELKEPSTKENVSDRASYEKRLQLERDRQAAEDIAASRFRGALGGRRANRAINRYERKSKKGKADHFDETLANQAKNYLDTESE